MPGPWSMTRSSTLSPWALAVTAGGWSRRAVAQRVGDQVDQDPFEQAGVGEDLGQVVGDVEADASAGRAEVVEGLRDGLGNAQRLRLHAQRAGLQAAHVEQVVDQAGEVGRGTRRRWRAVRRGRASSKITSGLRRLATAALAEASGVRRSWLTAASSAVRIRSASASGPAVGGLPREPFLAQRDGGLGGERLDDAPVGGRQGAAAQDEGERVVDGDLDVAVRRASCRAARRRRPRPARRPGRAADPATAAHRRRSSRVTLLRCERLAQLVQQCGQGPFAAQHAAGDGGQGLAPRRGPGRPAGSGGRRCRRPS